MPSWANTATVSTQPESGECAISFARECGGTNLWTFNYVVFDCPPYADVCSANPRFDFGDKVLVSLVQATPPEGSQMEASSLPSFHPSER